MSKIYSQLIMGVGVDIESEKRFSDYQVLHHRTLLRRIFTDRELKYCFSKKDPVPHLAARYAGKEAVYKALGDIGIKKLNTNDFRNVEIVRGGQGAPKVMLRKRLVVYKDIVISVSLSHAEGVAAAFAVAYRVQK